MKKFFAVIISVVLFLFGISVARKVQGGIQFVGVTVEKARYRDLKKKAPGVQRGLSVKKVPLAFG